jgi:predicted nucleic acid-binding protein
LTLVDTNILIDILSHDSAWFTSSLARFSERQSSGRMLIVDVVFAECATTFASAGQASEALEALNVQRSPMSDAALWRAAQAFREYRRRGGTKSNVLPDFFIGAQASVLGIPLLTRDAGRYRTYFPEVELVGRKV